MTLSFAYLLFTPKQSSIDAGYTPAIVSPSDYPDYPITYPLDEDLVGGGGGGSKSGGFGIGDKLADISHMFSPSSSRKDPITCPSPIPIIRELTFEETVKPVGVAVGGGKEVPWSSRIGSTTAPSGYDDIDETIEGVMNDELDGITTKMFAHSPGWSLFERLYLFNGSFYVVT